MFSAGGRYIAVIEPLFRIPYMFRQAGLGLLIGKRTWGGGYRKAVAVLLGLTTAWET
jgi:hypothetical protein